MLVFELHSFQYGGAEYFVTLENVIATNNSCLYCGGDQKGVIYALSVTDLVLANVSITNNNNYDRTIMYIRLQYLVN